MHRLGSVWASLYCWQEAAGSYQQGLLLEGHNQELVCACSCTSNMHSSTHLRWHRWLQWLVCLVSGHVLTHAWQGLLRLDSTWQFVADNFIMCI